MTENTITFALVLIGPGCCGSQPGNGKQSRARINDMREVICNSESRNKSKNQTIL